MEKVFYNPLNDMERNLNTTIALLEFYLKKDLNNLFLQAMSVYGNLMKKVNENDPTIQLVFMDYLSFPVKNILKCILIKKLIILY